MTQATNLIYKDAFNDMSLEGWVYNGEQPELISRNEQVFVHLVQNQEMTQRVSAQPDTVYKFKAFVDKVVSDSHASTTVCIITELDANGNQLNQKKCYAQYLNLFYVYLAMKTSADCQFVEITLTNVNSEGFPYDIYINDVNLFSVELEEKNLLAEDFFNPRDFEQRWTIPQSFSGCLRRPHENDFTNVTFYPFYQDLTQVSCSTQNTSLLVPGEVYKLEAYMKTDLNFSESFIFSSLSVLTVEDFSYSQSVQLIGVEQGPDDEYKYLVEYFYAPEYEAKKSSANIGGIMGYIDRIEVSY
jgi:hypothetical protein